MTDRFRIENSEPIEAFYQAFSAHRDCEDTQMPIQARQGAKNDSQNQYFEPDSQSIEKYLYSTISILSDINISGQSSHLPVKLISIRLRS